MKNQRLVGRAKKWPKKSDILNGHYSLKKVKNKPIITPFSKIILLENEEQVSTYEHSLLMYGDTHIL